MPRLLTIMGSGETAPTMVKAHREVFDRLGRAEPSAVLLDTPYGFQANADIISDRAVEYFSQSVGRRGRGGAAAAHRHGRRASRSSRPWPGSAARTGCSPGPAARRSRSASGRERRCPTCWPGSCGRRPAAPRVLERGRAHAGRRHRARLRDLQGRRRPVLAGRPRPAVRARAARRRHPPLRQHRGRQPRHPLLLPRSRPGSSGWSGSCPPARSCSASTSTPALIIDLDADTATIVGRGGVTLRQQGRQRVLEAGQTVPLDVLRAGAPTTSAVTDRSRAPPTDAPPPAPSSVAGHRPRWPRAPGPRRPPSRPLGGGRRRRRGGRRARPRRRHHRVVGRHPPVRRDGPRPSGAPGDDRAASARRRRRGLRDPRDRSRPLVEAALALRRGVRAERRYDLSDLLRDELAAAGRRGPRHRRRRGVGAQSGFVSAPVSAPCTSRAYLASTPDV